MDAMSQEMDAALSLEAFQTVVRGCRRCVEAGFLAEAHPVLWGHAGQPRMLIGQAPGARAHVLGVPWSGPSGKLLRAWFSQAGFEPERFMDDWYLTSLTKCFPGKAAAGPGDRAPSTKERALCRPHLEGEIGLVRPRLVVTLGRLAADAVIPSAKGRSLKDLVGSVHEVDFGYGIVPVVPLPHPSGVGRWLNDPVNRALVEVGLEKIAAIEQDAGMARSPGTDQ
jgi:uracil-DNA glycosylase